MKKKTLVLLIAVMLLVGGVIGGTLAWLTTKTEAVKNTFTTSNINITLKETDRPYKMVPGHTIEKDPKATVLGGSEPCYLFVKVEKSVNFDNYLTYEMADGWTALDGVANVYYREVPATADNTVVVDDTAFSILKYDKVSVSGEVTKEMMDKIESKTDPETEPTLTFTAYASQLYKNGSTKFTATEAWENAQPTP
ncbi:MAG: SipW-dependent-type signal peptide-containing protein [Peptoniphilus sp.]|nr:SipW-dependent-type signal peptide-containing protein [Peptoniphilus sp.]